MVIDVNTENHTYQGKQILDYKNNSPDTLNRVFYHLFFNAFRPNSEQVLASKYATFERRGVAEKIANLKSEDWGLVEIIGDSEPKAPLSQIKVISFKEKHEWTVETKYNIGKKKLD